MSRQDYGGYRYTVDGKRIAFLLHGAEALHWIWLVDRLPP